MTKAVGLATKAEAMAEATMAAGAMVEAIEEERAEATAVTAEMICGHGGDEGGSEDGGRAKVAAVALMERTKVVPVMAVAVTMVAATAEEAMEAMARATTAMMVTAVAKVVELIVAAVESTVTAVMAEAMMEARSGTLLSRGRHTRA